jgi:hypothetical protein
MTLLLLAALTLLPFALVYSMGQNEQKARHSADRLDATAHAWKVAHRNARRVRRLP